MFKEEDTNKSQLLEKLIKYAIIMNPLVYKAQNQVFLSGHYET
jgi:hypothetical protein